MIDQRKIDLFFTLIRTVYGAGKFASQWPTELDLQAAQTMWSEQISRHTPDELRDALRHAQQMASNGETEWQWPNIGLILSGARRFATAAHRERLSEPARDIPPAHERTEIMQRMRQEVGL